VTRGGHTLGCIAWPHERDASISEGSFLSISPLHACKEFTERVVSMGGATFKLVGAVAPTKKLKNSAKR
jgi:hypothetical protein